MADVPRNYPERMTNPDPKAAPDVINVGGTSVFSGGQDIPSMTAGYGSNPWADYFRNYQNFKPVQYQAELPEESRARQEALIQDIQKQAQGDPNSYAQQQLRKSTEAAAAQQRSLASTMRGQGAGAAMRQGAYGAAGVGRGLAGNQALLMLQEQQAARAQLEQALAQQRGQDIQQEMDRARATAVGRDLLDSGTLFKLGGEIEASSADAQRRARDLLTQMGLDLESDKAAGDMRNKLVEGAGTALSLLEKSYNRDRASDTGRPGYKQSEIDKAWEG